MNLTSARFAQKLVRIIKKGDHEMNNDRHESIIISTEHKNVLLASFVLFAVLVALKWFVIGYWLGKREGC